MTDSPIKWAFGENKPHYTRFNTTSPHLPACIGHRHQPASHSTTIRVPDGMAVAPLRKIPIVDDKWIRVIIIEHRPHQPKPSRRCFENESKRELWAS